ncbi:hypothetical protein ACI8AF_09820 [Blastococcus sp. SYSU D00669]
MKRLLLLAVVLLTAACSAEGEHGLPGEIRSTDVTVPSQPWGGEWITHATGIAVQEDGTWVVFENGLDETAVVRVRDGEVVSRSHLVAHGLAGVVRADGSVALVTADPDGTALQVAVVPPGGDPDEVEPVATRPVDPPLHLEDEYADVSAVPAPDGRDVIALLDPADGGPVLVRLDPVTGAVEDRHELDASPASWVLSEDGEELVLFLADGGATQVVRMPADLSGGPGEPVVLPGDAWLATVAPDGTLYFLLDAGGGPELHSLAPDAAESERLARLPEPSEAYPQGEYRDLAVDPEAGLAFLVGSGGEDTDRPEPFLLAVGLDGGEVGEPQVLAGDGSAAAATVVDGALLVVGTGARDAYEDGYDALVWTYAYPA